MIRLVLLLALAASPAISQSRNCGPRGVIVQQLADKFGETRQAIGISTTNLVMELFASVEVGTWTITVTAPDGLTCLVAVGRAFEALSEALPEKGDKL